MHCIVVYIACIADMKWWRTALLVVLMVASAAASEAEVVCNSSFDCSFNGECPADACVCDAGAL
jgi:hypothetical protein